MSSWLDMYELIGVPKIPEDEVIPDGQVHVVYIEDVENQKYVPLWIQGYQWDIIWWIWRLSDDELPFDMYMYNMLVEIYEAYMRKKRKTD